MLTEILSTLSPTAGQIAAFFTAWNKMPPPILKAVLASLDEQMLTKIATWAETFADHINDLGPDSVTPEQIQQSLEPGTSDDFFEVMTGTKFRGPKLDSKTLAVASNQITKAIKAKNYTEAVWAGMTLARMLPV